MGKLISNHFFSFEDTKLPGEQVADYIDYTQDDFYFRHAGLKFNRIEKLKKHFSRTPLKRIFISSTFANIDFKLDGWDVICLEKNFFHFANKEAFEQKRDYLKNSLVITNNNDMIIDNNTWHYSEFYINCEFTIFAAWDFDNHHGMRFSTFLAAHSDIYIPAHHENLYILSRYNWLIAGPVYAGIIQWSRKFIADHLPEILQSERSDAPLGMHVYYPAFPFRTKIVSTLHHHYSTIGFTDLTFHDRSTEDRLHEWYSHKSHWVAPVLNDVSIRIFDALATGGIPIIPESLRFLPPINDIGSDHIVFYNPHDIIKPQEVVAKANELFDKGGRDKMIERHVFALNNHHGSIKILRILKYVNEAFSLKMRIGN